MQVAVVAKLPDGLLQGLNAHSAFLLGPLDVQLQLCTLSIEGLASLLQLPVGLPLPC